MAEGYVGEIRVFGFNFAPVNWSFCNGNLIPISQNSALFSIVGTIYGGNGTTTFALPNLQGQLAVGFGNGPGLSPWIIGEVNGEANHTLVIGEVPQHTHTANAGDGVAFAAQTAAPSATSYFGRERGGAYATTSNTTLAPSAISPNAGGLPHANTMPTLVMNPCICQFGAFPSRN
jgi:microcystin-dependent protein